MTTQMNINEDDPYISEEVRIEERRDKELKSMNTTIILPRANQQEAEKLRFDSDFINENNSSGTESEEEDDEEGEDYSGYELDEEQQRQFMTAGMAAYTKTCKSFHLHSFPMRTVINKLYSNYINLRHHGLGDKGCLAISQCLKKNPLITCLDLSENAISVEGVSSLMKVLRNNRSVTELNLSRNRIGYKGAHLKTHTEESAGQMIKTMLVKNNKLKKLVLSWNKLSDSDIVDICVALAENSSLYHLDLSNNELGEISGAHLCQALSANVGLKELRLEWNKLRTLGAIHISTGLRNNNVLTYLNLDWNGVSDVASHKIAQMLQSNTALETLSIANNRIVTTNQSAKQLATGLRMNTSLRNFNMSYNPIDEEMLKVLVDSILKNESSVLEVFDLQGCLDSVVLKDAQFNQYLDKVKSCKNSLELRL